MRMEQRGHAEFDCFDRKVRQGRDDKAFQCRKHEESNANLEHAMALA